MKPPMFHDRTVAYFLAVLFLVASEGMGAQDGNTVLPDNLTAAQIVEQIQQRSEARKKRLRHYEALRHYKVEYRGYSRVLVARMDVEVTYDVFSGKEFRIVAQSGSKLLCEKVLKRAIESEFEASQDGRQAAISDSNYRFRLAGMKMLDSHPAYILDLEPLHKNKFLLRGRIWVDAVDFAVEKIEAEPAKNPSFWITRTLIRHENTNTGGFWLPKQLRSESKVRVGGTAVLTIDYGTYHIASEILEPAVAR